MASTEKNTIVNEPIPLNNHKKINNNLKISLNSKKVVTANSKAELKITSHKNIFEKINSHKNTKINEPKQSLHFKSLSSGKINNDIGLNKEKLGSEKKSQIHRIIKSAYGSRIENESNSNQYLLSSKSSPSSNYSSRKNLMEETMHKNFVPPSNVSILKSDTPQSANCENGTNDNNAMLPQKTSAECEAEKKLDKKFDNPPPLKMHKFEILKQKLINYIKECILN